MYQNTGIGLTVTLDQFTVTVTVKIVTASLSVLQFTHFNSNAIPVYMYSVNYVIQSKRQFESSLC